MSHRILLVASDQEFKQSVARLLDDEHTEVISSGDGIDAVFLLNETTPDLLIAEVVLPGKSGFELCRYAREEPDFQPLPVILVDSRFDVLNQSVARSVAADVYLSRPLDESELIRVVHKLLESKATNDNEGLVSARQVGMDPPSPLSESYSSNKRELINSGLPTRTRYQPPEGRTTNVLREAVPGQTQNARYIILGAMLAVTILAAVWLAILEQDHTSSIPATQNPALAGEIAKGETFAIDEQQPEKSRREQDRGIDLLPVDVSEADASLFVVRKDEAADVVPATRPVTSTGATRDKVAEKSRSEAIRDSSSVVQRDDKPSRSNNKLAPPPSRPRNVSSIRSNTTRSHLKRSGYEMKQAGIHFGRGTKHLGQGGGKATVWAGKRVGKGVKRVGKAFKKIF